MLKQLTIFFLVAHISLALGVLIKQDILYLDDGPSEVEANHVDDLD